MGLALSRKVGESINIGDDIVITLTKSGSSRSTILIDAPATTVIRRTEILPKKKGDECAAESAKETAQLQTTQ